MRVVLAFGLIAVLSALVGVVLSGASYEPAPGGLPDAGPVVGWLPPVVGALTFAAAMATVGWLLLAGFLDPTAGKTTVSRRGRTALLRQRRSRCVVRSFSRRSRFQTRQHSGNRPRDRGRIEHVHHLRVGHHRRPNLLICALLAAVICVGAAISVSLTGTTVWFVMAVVAVAVPAMAGHAAGPRRPRSGTSERRRPRGRGDSGVGGLIALGATVWPKAETVGIAARRFGLLAMACVVVLVASGIANAYVRLGSPADLVTSGYGRLVPAKSALLIALVAIAAWIRKRLLPNSPATNRGARSRSSRASNSR